MGATGSGVGGVELGPRWQNFRYLRYATLAAVLPAPALPPEHSKDGMCHFPPTAHLQRAAARLLLVSPPPAPPRPPAELRKRRGGG